MPPAHEIRMIVTAPGDGSYAAPPWLPGGHAQTIYAALFAPRPHVIYRRERWDTPDGDFVDLDWVVNPEPQQSRINLSRPDEHGSQAPGNGNSARSGLDKAPLVALFHGLEGNSRSHYAVTLMAALQKTGWRGVVIHFRGCSGEINRLPRAYHSGDSAEIDWILHRLRQRHPAAPLHAVGVSLGGNALLKWLGERRENAAGIICTAVAVSAPVDLMAAGDALDQGFNLLYARHFLSTMKRKSLAKLAHFPGLFDGDKMRTARTLRAFDDVVTAPLHDFKNTDDYWLRASSKPLLRHISVPTLLVNARNDPFLPGKFLPLPTEVSAAVTLDFPAAGGHAGFVSGAFPGHLDWLPHRILGFFNRT